MCRSLYLILDILVSNMEYMDMTPYLILSRINPSTGPNHDPMTLSAVIIISPRMNIAIGKCRRSGSVSNSVSPSSVIGVLTRTSEGSVAIRKVVFGQTGVCPTYAAVFVGKGKILNNFEKKINYTVTVQNHKVICIIHAKKYCISIS